MYNTKTYIQKAKLPQNSNKHTWENCISVFGSGRYLQYGKLLIKVHLHLAINKNNTRNN